MVLLTDGRANVSLAKSNDDPDAIGPDAVKPTTVRTPHLYATPLCLYVTPEHRASSPHAIKCTVCLVYIQHTIELGVITKGCTCSLV